MGKIHLSLAALVLPVLSFGAIGAEMEEVVVTGSYIKSSPTDGASPVDVVDRDYLDEMVPVSVSDITGHLTVNSGSENVPDSFTSGATQGTSNVNLRGLGLGSTLVLVNGRRNTLAAATANDGSTFVDTSMIPASALQRVEVLKEGAASIYGSDAVAGVVRTTSPRRTSSGSSSVRTTRPLQTARKTGN
jgi:iron complex outermembrane recepter protein